MSYKTPDPFTGALLQAARNWISQQGGLGAVAKQAPQFAASLLPNLSRSLGASNPVSAFFQDYNPRATYANQGQGPAGRAIGGALDAGTQIALLSALAGPEAALPSAEASAMRGTQIASEGAPLTVYRGTQAGKAVADQGVTGGVYGPGFYVGDSQAVAKQFAAARPGQPVVESGTAAAKNLFPADAPISNAHLEALASSLREFSPSAEASFRASVAQGASGEDAYRALVDALGGQKPLANQLLDYAGFDGIRYLAPQGSGGYTGFVLFHPEAQFFPMGNR